MPYAVLTTLWVSVAAVFLTLASGLRLFHVEQPLRTHVLLALTSVTLALFSHTMAMFYFIGISKKVKEFVASWEEEIRNDFRRRLNAMKRKLFPWILLACLALMAAFLAGGAHDARLVSRSTHAYLTYFAVVAHAHVAVLETLYLFRHLDLIRDVNDLARRRETS